MVAKADALQAHFGVEDYYTGVILEWIYDSAIDMSNLALLEETGIDNQKVAFGFKFLMPLGFASIVTCFVLLAKKKELAA